MSSAERPSPSITLLLEATRQGDPQAEDQLFRAVYEELRRLARQRMAAERPGSTLQPTALVNEVYLRMFPENPQGWENRAHFFGSVARCMRRILVDRSRRRGAQKRAGDQKRVPLEPDVAAVTQGCDLFALDQALDRLARRDERKSRVIELRYFLGLSIDETAEVLGVSPRTVDEDWRLARAWLRRDLSQLPDSGPAS